MDAIKNSWKTTAAAVLAVVIGVGKVLLDLLNGEPVTGEDIAALLVILGIGGGLAVAKDGDQD
jgi:hypothetical protein